METQEIPGKLMLIGLGNTSCRKVLKEKRSGTAMFKQKSSGVAMKGEIPVQTGDVQLR